jgi:hypothetical protein
MKTMTTRKLATATGTLGFVFSLTWQAFAGSLYFDQYIAPVLRAHEHAVPNPQAPLYDPAGTPPLHPTPADRKVFYYADDMLALTAGDVVPAAVTTDWDDRQRPELFRIAFAAP